MPALVIVDIDVTDPVGYEEYKRLASVSIAAHGGRYVARGGATTVLEGPWSPKRLVVLQFASADAARAWYASSEYAAAKEARLRTTAATTMVVVETL